MKAKVILMSLAVATVSLTGCVSKKNYRRMVKNLCLCIKVTEAEDEEFRIIHAMQLSPERLYFRID